MTPLRMTTIENVGVIGAGVMGAGIAAHVANAGIAVILLDVVPDGASNRSVLAETAVNNMLKADPAPLMHKRNSRRIQTGNLDDDLSLLSECDLVIEAVIEDLEIKQDLYRRIDAARKHGSIVTSNTSTIPLAKLVSGLPESFAREKWWPARTPGRMRSHRFRSLATGRWARVLFGVRTHLDS